MQYGNKYQKKFNEHNKENNSNSSQLLISQEHGKPLDITPLTQKSNNRKREHTSISTSQAIEIKSKYNLSFTKFNKLSTDLRIATGNRKLFEPHLDKTIREKSHVLDSFYEIKEEKFINLVKDKKNKNKSNIEISTIQDVVLCNDVEKLCETVQKMRSMSSVQKKLALMEEEHF